MTTTETTRGERFAHLLGIATIGSEGHDLKAGCVSCSSSDAFRIHQDKGFAWCHSCNAKFSPLELAEHQLGERPKAIDALVEMGWMEPRQNGHHNGNGLDLIDRVAKAKGVSRFSLEVYGAAIAKRGMLDVVRFPTYSADGVCSHFDLTEDGKGYNQKGAPAGLFLAEGKTPNPGEVHLGLEGVKDAAAAHALNYRAVGFPTSQLSAKFVSMFRDVHVILVPDRDKAGLQGAEITAARLFGTAASVKIAALPVEFKESHGLDLRDALKIKDGEQLVRQCIESAQAWKPPTEDTGPDKIPSIGISEGRTELANARRFVRDHGKDFRHVGLWKKWIWWNGRHWEIDHTERAAAYAKSLAQRLWQELGRLGPTKDKDENASMLSFIKATSTARGIRNLLELARSEPGISIMPDQLDNHRGERAYLLNCENGTLDLRTGQLRPHDRADLFTKIAGSAFEPAAACPTFDGFIHDIFEGNDSLMGYAQRMCGYLLTANTMERCLFFLYGVGKNGKSTLTSAMRDVLGDYAVTINTELLLDKKNSQHPTEICDLAGARMAVANETEEGRKFSESLLKMLTGGSDRLKGRRCYEDFWEFDAEYKPVITGNHRPTIKGTDDGIWDRIRLIPFKHRFSEPDADMPEKLRTERAGILAWCVRGTQLWLADGLADPAEVIDATAGYRNDMDAVGQFLADCCVTGSNALKVRSRDLYAAYQQWCEENGEYAHSGKRFGGAMTERGFERITNNGTVYTGIGLLSEEQG